MLRHHMIVGGGGVQLHAVETGNAKGRPIVFIHGISQCGMVWNRQLSSDLAETFRLVALDRPVLSGWSYGPLVILDYLRHYGEDDIRGANFIGGVTKLGSDAAAAVLTAGFLGLIPGFFSTNTQ